jgi:hypothetical protein
MDNDEPAPQQIVSERFTVGLIPRSVDELRYLRHVTGLNKADLINRAIGLYSMFEAERRAGKEILLRDPEGNVEVIRFVN